MLHEPWFEFALVALIVLSSALVMVEILWGEKWDRETPWFQTAFKIADGAICGLFLGELGLRWWTYRNRARFFARYWPDLLASLPLYGLSWSFLRLIRLIRLIRLFRVGTLLRRKYAAGAGGEFIVIFAIAGVVVLIAGAIMRHQEFSTAGQPGHADPSYSFWWSVLSMISNQPADNVPVTTAGRIVAVLIVLTGLCLFAIVTGTAAAVMSQRLRSLEANPMDLDELENHIILCGWDRRAPLVIEELQHSAEERHRAIVVVAELDELPPLNWKIVNRDLIYLVTGDFTKAELLERAGIRRAAKAIIVSDKSGNRSDQDRDARTILAALTIEKLNKDIYTCAELLNREHEAHLRMAGVEDVVSASEYGATLISSMAIHSGISSIMGELLSVQYGNEFFKLDLPPWLEGKTFSDAVALLTRRGAILIALDKPLGGKRHEIVLNPPADRVLQRGEILVVISRTRPDMRAP